MKRVEFAFIGTSEIILKRCQSICETYDYGFDHCASVDSLFEKELTFSKTQFFVLSALDTHNNSEIAGMVQILKQTSPDSFCVICVDSKIAPASLEFIKKSGANLLLIESEISSTCKLEFAASQMISSAYLPIKVSELAIDTIINLDLYFILPLNKKFLPFIRKNTLVNQERLLLLKEMTELYIKREDLELWMEYTRLNENKTAMSLSRRCRAQFLSLSIIFCDLVLAVSDRSEYTSFTNGKILYQKCQELSSDLLTTLSALGNAWEVVDQSAINSISPIERSPAIACYAGLLSLGSGFGDPQEVMISALMADIGLLEVGPKLLKQINDNDFANLHPEDKGIYQNHPTASLNQLLSRKVPVPEKMKAIILNSHENFNQKGFPNHPRPDKIPPESFILQMCEMIDRKSLIRFGEEKLGIEEVKKRFFAEQEHDQGKFPIALLLNLKKHA